MSELTSREVMNAPTGKLPVGVRGQQEGDVLCCICTLSYFPAGGRKEGTI